MWFGFDISWRKMQKNKKKMWRFSKSFTSYLHKGSTLEHDVNRFWKLQFRATTFVCDLFLECGHVTTLPITYWLDPDRYNHRYLLFSHFWVKNYWYFLFWTSTLDPECITQQYWPPLLFFFWFSPYFMPVFHLEMQMFPYLEMYIGPWKQCPPSIITNPSLFFSVFFCILLPSFIQQSIFFYIWKCTLDPETGPIHHQ